MARIDGDFPDLQRRKLRPALEQRGQGLLPVLTRPLLDGHSVLKPLHVDRGRFAEGQLGVPGVNLPAPQVAVLLLQFCQPALRDRIMVGFQGFPNFLAMQIEPRIVTPTLVTDQVLQLRFFPSPFCGLSFHNATVEMTVKKQAKTAHRSEL